MPIRPYILYTLCMDFPLIYVVVFACSKHAHSPRLTLKQDLSTAFFLSCEFFLFPFRFLFRAFLQNRNLHFRLRSCHPTLCKPYGGQGQLVSPVLTAMPSSSSSATTSSSITATDFVFIMKMPRYMEVCLPLALSPSLSHKLTFARRWQCDCEQCIHTSYECVQ